MRSHIMQMLLLSGLGGMHALMWFLLPLEAGRQCTTVMQEKRRQRIRPMEEPVLPVQANRIYKFWIIATGGWSTPGSRSPRGE